MAIAANYGLQGAIQEWNGIPVYPATGDWDNGGISTFAKHHRADYVITLCDAWVMKPDLWPDVEMAMWAPIDHYPIPPAVLGVLSHERVHPIAMSRDGEQWMQKFELDPLYVPHAVDTSIFKPMPELRNGARAALKMPRDAFIVGMVAANKGNPSFPRKSFPQVFDAFHNFSKTHPDAYLYVHSEAQPRDGGIDLVTLARAIGIPEDRLAFPPENAWYLGIMDNRFVANVYQAFDVLCSPSMGEGFGIPILEAQACGVPVIVAEHSAMTELCGAGWLVRGDRWWDALQTSFAIVPAISEIERALEQAYEARNDPRLSQQAWEFAQDYDADKVATEYWMPALEQLGSGRKDVPPLKVSRQVRRAQARKSVKA